MRDLVHDRERGRRHLVERDRFGVEEEARLAERDAAEVLHRAEREVGERDQVALLARIGEAVVVGEVLDRERAEVERELGEVAAAGHVHDPHRDAARVDRRRDLQRPDDPRDEIGRHRDRLAEPDAHPLPVGSGSRPISGPFEIASRSSATSRVTAKTALNSGSSKQGNAARACGASNCVAARTCSRPVVVDERAAVEAEQAVADLARERSVEGRGTGRELGRR